MNLRGKTVGIVGYGVEGKSTYAWLKKHQGKDIFVFDDSSSHEQKQENASPSFSPFSHLQYADILFRSPGIHPEKIKKNLPSNWSGTLTSATQFFLENAPTKNIIGVTGTKGKGTTSSLIAKMLEKAGFQTFLGGNIGTPVFDFFDALNEKSVVVLELSSFQLYDVKKSPKYAVLLRTDTEHLDWHSDVFDYRNAKKNIFQYQSKNDVLVYFGGSSIVQEMISSSGSQKISVMASPQNREKNWIDMINQRVVWNNEITNITAFDIALRGTFHHENVLAAIAIAKQFAVPNETIISVLKSFSGLPMRMEKVAEEDGRTYYNDSFSTIPETTISALSTFSTPVFLIVGGSEKYSNFTELSNYCARHLFLKKIYLIGETSSRIAESLKAAGFFHFEFADSLAAIVADFKIKSQKGDSLLLSPGCASFGMFKNYKDRGHQFENLVKKN